MAGPDSKSNRSASVSSQQSSQQPNPQQYPYPYPYPPQMSGNPSASPSASQAPYYPMYPYPPYPYGQPPGQGTPTENGNAKASGSTSGSEGGGSAGQGQGQAPPGHPANLYYPPPFGMFPPYGYGFPGQPPQPPNGNGSETTKPQQLPPGYPPNFPMPSYPFPYSPYMGMPPPAAPGTPGQSSASGSQPPLTPNAAQMQGYPPPAQLSAGGPAAAGMNWPYPAYPPPYWGWPYAPPPSTPTAGPAAPPAIEIQPSPSRATNPSILTQIASAPKKKIATAVQLAALEKARQVKRENHRAAQEAKAVAEAAEIAEREEAIAKRSAELSEELRQNSIANRLGGSKDGEDQMSKGKKRKNIVVSPVLAASVPEPAAAVAKRKGNRKGWAVLAEAEDIPAMDASQGTSSRRNAAPEPIADISRSSARESSRPSMSDAEDSGEGSAGERRRRSRKPRDFYGNYDAADLGVGGGEGVKGEQVQAAPGGEVRQSSQKVKQPIAPIDVLNLSSPPPRPVAGPSNHTHQSHQPTIRVYGSSSSESESDDAAGDDANYCTSCIAKGLSCSQGTEEASQGRCRQCEAMGTSCSWVEGWTIVPGLGEPKAGKYRRLHALEVPADRLAKRPKGKVGDGAGIDADPAALQPKKRRRRRLLAIDPMDSVRKSALVKQKEKGILMKQKERGARRRRRGVNRDEMGQLGEKLGPFGRKLNPRAIAAAQSLATQYDVFEPAETGTYKVAADGKPVLRHITHCITTTTTYHKRLQNYIDNGIPLKKRCKNCADTHMELACVLAKDGKICQGCWGLPWKCSLLDVSRARLALEKEALSSTGNAGPADPVVDTEAAQGNSPSGTNAHPTHNDPFGGESLSGDHSDSDAESEGGDVDEEDAGLLNVAMVKGGPSDSARDENEGEVDDHVQELVHREQVGESTSTSPMLHNIAD